MSKNNSPTLEEWKRLYDLMSQIKELTPWEWMEEDDIFGIQMPGTKELGFVSVMGMLGEHLAIAVYQGAKGLSGFWNMHSQGPKLSPEFVLQIPQLQASFEDRELIDKTDREVMKKLGLKFRGAKAWPQFRCYRPGCFPWHIDKNEAAMLICALEQLLQLAPRFKENPQLFAHTNTEHDYLMRVSKDGTWGDEIQHVTFHQEMTLDLLMDEETFEHLRKMMPGQFTIEIDLYMMNEPVKEKTKERPYFPFMLMLADHDSGMILGIDLLSPLPSMEAMWSEIPALVVDKMAQGFAPKQVQVKDDLLYYLLQPVAQELGFNISKQSHLKKIDQAKRELQNYMGLRGI